MNEMKHGTRLAAKRFPFWRLVGASLLLGLVLCTPAFAQEAQQITVSGTVTTSDGTTLRAVTVRIRGTETSTETDEQGRYTLTAPTDAVLVFARIGFRSIGLELSGRTTLDVIMERVITVLPEVVVTGYQTQRRADITGAVASVNVSNTTKQTSVSVLKDLGGAVSGVTENASGSPGSRSTVRIRGISSFQNNDPLYIVDGTPVPDASYLNWLDPNDIGSIQVLKDASAASIYGSRASNGVIIIETKRGRAGRRQVTLDVRTGVASPTRGYNNILIQNSLDYFNVVKTSYENAGLAVPTNIFGDPNNPSVPAYIWPNDGVNQTTDTLNASLYSYPDNLIMPGSAGTNWWDAVFSPAQVRNANLAVSGGGEDNAYHVSFNYLDQNGTAAYTRYQRGGVRVNTAFNLDRVSVGENIALSRDQSHGGLDDNGINNESGILGKNIFQQPVVPIYDIGGNFASGKANGLSNLTNPLKVAYYGKDNINRNDHMFGNVFAGLDASHGLSLKTRFGFNLNQYSFRGYNFPTPENAEPTTSNGINETYNQRTDWTWSNTLNYIRTAGRHNLTVLLGQEVNRTVDRNSASSCASLISSDVNARFIQDALCDPTTKNVTSAGFKSSLLSFFGKADYNFADRYYVSLTLRRDGSSKLGPTHQWGTFPAVGLGWRLTNGPFFHPGSFVSNLMLRFGWGVTGNQNIPAGRIYSQYGADRGDTFYDIGGTNTSLQPGYRQIALGNQNLQWEEDRSENVGADLEFLQGRGTFTVDVYKRKTNKLLFDPRLPATAGALSPSIQNIGAIQNTGVDFSAGFRGSLGEGTLWSVSFNGSHYKNEILNIDGTSTCFRGPLGLRQQNPSNNCVGYAIGSFYGLVADGYYQDSTDAAPFWNDGARPGRIKFKDLNGDGHITSADQAIIGSPHPKFTGGLDLSLRHGNWDVSATIFGSFGGKIFNAQKYWGIFRYFDTNVRSDLAANSVVLDGPCSGTTCPGKVTNPGAKYPRLDASDVFSRQFSSYWLESGTYVRLRVLQLGYNLPPALIRWIPAARVYLQAENLFTITGYSGLDPALPAWSATAAAGDIRDQTLGVDGGTYPSNRTITVGITTTF